MLRHFTRFARTLVPAIALAVALTGCGIKGPLTPAPQPEAARSPGSDAAPRKP